jgi:hypothetical protein
LLDEAGMVDEIEDAYLRRLAISKLYDKDTLLMTGTRQGRDALNEMIRERLTKRGEIDPKTERSFTVVWKDGDGVRRSDVCALAVGDRITFLEGEHRRYEVENGMVADVVATAKGKLTVRLEDGRQLALDTSYYSAVGYGYALTTYKSQGQTYDKVVVDADTRYAHLQDMRNCYVQITRARNDAKIFTDDREELRDLAGVLSSKKDTLELDHTMAEVVAMEQRLRGEVLQARARSEAGAKISEAEAFAARTTREFSKEYGMEERKDESNETSRRDEPASGESSQPARALPTPQGADPARSEEVSQSPQTQKGRSSSSTGAGSFAFDSSVTANVRNFKVLFGDEPLTGTADMLRKELRLEIAAGRTEDQAVEKRLADLAETTQELLKATPMFLAASEQARRMAYASLTREVERRLMLTGELPVENVRQAHEALQASLERPATVASAGATASAAAAKADDLVRIHNQALLESANGVERIEKALLAEMKAVEDQINGRAVLTRDAKERLARFFNAPEAADLLIAKPSPDLRVAGAEVALGLRSADEAAAGRSKPDVRALEQCMGLATEASKQAGQDRAPERDRSDDFGLER